MAHFLTVIVLDLTQIACRSAQTILVSIIILFLIGLTRLGCVDSGGRGGAFLLSLLLVISTAFFLLFLPSLSGRLWVTGAGNWQFWGPGLRFFYLRVFYQLGLGLGCQSMHQLIALVALLVEVLDGRGLYLRLGLGSDCSFDQGVPTI